MPGRPSAGSAPAIALQTPAGVPNVCPRHRAVTVGSPVACSAIVLPSGLSGGAVDGVNRTSFTPYNGESRMAPSEGAIWQGCHVTNGRGIYAHMRIDAYMPI
jgi:hypothetical protein